MGRSGEGAASPSERKRDTPDEGEAGWDEAARLKKRNSLLTDGTEKGIIPAIQPRSVAQSG